MIGACNGRDDTPCCAEYSLRRVLSVGSGLPFYPDAETLPRRDKTQFLKNVRAQNVIDFIVFFFKFVFFFTGSGF